jgi:hypothetical protein
LELVKSGRLASFGGGVVSESSVLGSVVGAISSGAVVGAVSSVVSTVVNGESCHDICAVSSVQLVITSPKWLRQGGGGCRCPIYVRLFAFLCLLLLSSTV